MYLLAEARGRGVGGALLDRCLEAARSFGYGTVYLETLSGMDAAEALYRRRGFGRLDRPRGRTGHCGCDRWYGLELGEPPA